MDKKYLVPAYIRRKSPEIGQLIADLQAENFKLEQAAALRDEADKRRLQAALVLLGIMVFVVVMVFVVGMVFIGAAKW